MKIVVHLSPGTEITLSVGSVETSWSWPMLTQYFIATTLVEHSQLLKLLTSLIVNDDDEQQATAYRFRHGEGYSTVIYPTWAGCTTKNRGGDTNQQFVQANIVLKPRDNADAAAAVRYIQDCRFCLVSIIHIRLSYPVLSHTSFLQNNFISSHRRIRVRLSVGPQ